MTVYEPFLDNQAHIDELSGQRFVVLRAPAELRASCRESQNFFREHLRGLQVSYPAWPHVTLCGFAAGTPLVEAQRLVGTWAVTIPPLRIEVGDLSWFSPPFQIVIVEIQKTPALFAALAELRARAEKEGLCVSTVVPVEQWRLHMSIAYCSRLPETEWRGVVAFVQTSKVARVFAEVNAAELIAFDKGQEYSGGTYALGRGDQP